MSEVAVLVVSCDGYSDLWNPFFENFWRNWPDCPYPVYLGANHRQYSDSQVRSILVGDDHGWGRGLRLMLDRIRSSRVILFLEDFLILQPVSSSQVEKMVQLASEQRVGCLRLFPHPPPTRKLPGFQGIGELRRGDEWRVSTQTAIWKTELLHSLAWSEFTAWDFEIIGTLLSNKLNDRFWGVYEPVIDYRHGVWRGKWMPSGLAICREAGVAVDLGAREILSETELGGKPTLQSLQPTAIMKRVLPGFLHKILLRYIRLWRGPAYIEEFKRRFRSL